MDTDAVCESALRKIRAKYIAGMKEHGGIGLEKANMSQLELVKNMQEEAIDMVMYCEAMIREMEKQTKARGKKK